MLFKLGHLLEIGARAKQNYGRRTGDWLHARFVDVSLSPSATRNRTALGAAAGRELLLRCTVGLLKGMTRAI